MSWIYLDGFESVRNSLDLRWVGGKKKADIRKHRECQIRMDWYTRVYFAYRKMGII